MLVLLFRSRVSLEAEILILRHQLNIQRRHLPKRLAFSAMDRLIFVGLYRLVPNTIKALTIVKPDTVILHRAGFRSYWRWKSRHRCGRPIAPLEIRRLIREMSIANPLWGAPRIHGELLKLGIVIGQTSVAKYMARRGGPSLAGLPERAVALQKLLDFQMVADFRPLACPACVPARRAKPYLTVFTNRRWLAASRNPAHAPQAL